MGLSKDALTKLLHNRELLDQKGGVEGIAKLLNSDLEHGLSVQGVETSRETYGRNVLPEIESASFLELVWEGLQDKTLIMLSVAAVVSLILGIRENPTSGWIEGAAILIAVAIVVLVTATNDYEKEKQFRKLNAKKDMKNIKVLRGGEKTEVVVFDLVVGDVVLIDTGDIFTADGLFISGHNLLVDESSATGETDSLKKGMHEDHDPFFLSGTKCLDGVGKMLVIAIGEFSFQGKNMMSLRVESGDTPLQEKLNDLSDEIGYFGGAMAAIMFVTLTARDCYHVMVSGGQFDEHFFSGLIKYIITAITILVVAIPEGLPLAVTMALAYSMVKMLEDNNLVRKLEACETMGGATNICSDKTGTLTENKMSVVRAYIADLSIENATVTTKSICSAINDDLRESICEGICINATAFRKPGEKEFVGSKTESALLIFAENIDGKQHEEYRNNAKVIYVYPFSSALKQMRTVCQRGKTLRMYVKGASEIVLANCDQFVDSNGKANTIDAKNRQNLEDKIMSFATDGLRTVCIAYADLPANNFTTNDWEKQAPTPPLTLMGILGIEDPLRAGILPAVNTCKNAGINVRMVTGDNIVTAKNIAAKAGIWNGDDSACMEGPTYRELKGKALKDATRKLQVLARSSPLDKKILVETLMEMGEVVAVTGDGTNDGPALKTAHVGFSMGITGTDIAIEASDIVLMDDNFSSIVKAVMWGRNVYDSIRKFIQFQLTVNIVAVVLAFIGALSNDHGESPLKPVQLLWVNLIMDTLAALALATEAPSPGLLNRPPYSSDRSSLITRTMWKNIFGQAAFQLAINLLLLYNPQIFFPGCRVDSERHMTIFFNTFVMCQLFNEINSRKINGEFNVFENLFRNYIFLGVMIFTMIVQYFMVQYGGEFAGCVPLSSEDWKTCISIGAFSIPVGFILNMIPVQNTERVITKLHND